MFARQMNGWLLKAIRPPTRKKHCCDIATVPLDWFIISLPTNKILYTYQIFLLFVHQIYSNLCQSNTFIKKISNYFTYLIKVQVCFYISELRDINYVYLPIIIIISLFSFLAIQKTKCIISEKKLCIVMAK